MDRLGHAGPSPYFMEQAQALLLKKAFKYKLLQKYNNQQRIHYSQNNKKRQRFNIETPLLYTTFGSFNLVVHSFRTFPPPISLLYYLLPKIILCQTQLQSFISSPLVLLVKIGDESSTGSLTQPAPNCDENGLNRVMQEQDRCWCSRFIEG